MATKPKAKAVETKPDPASPKEPKKPEKTVQELDIENLKRSVDYLEKKVRSQSEQLHLMKTICDSCQGTVTELRKSIRRVAEISGVSI